MFGEWMGDDKIILKDSGCKCCEEIEIWQEHIKREKIDNVVESKMFAKLSIYTWRKGEKKIKGNQSGTITTKAHDLKYCPSCGRKVGGAYGTKRS